MQKLMTFIQWLILPVFLATGCATIAPAQTTRPATTPSTQPATRPASLLDRAPLVYTTPAPPQSRSYVPAFADLAKIANRSASVYYDCSPNETYTWSGGPITAGNVTINGHGSKLYLSRQPGSNSDVQISAARFTLIGFEIHGDGSLAFRINAPAATFENCITYQMNSFVFVDNPDGYSVTLRRCVQGDMTGGQWFYCMADSATLEDCQLPYGAKAESPVRFSALNGIPPVGCLVTGGSIIQPAGKQNLQKPALAIRGGAVTVDSVYVWGAITGGEIVGTDTAKAQIKNCTFDYDPVFPNVSFQKGVRLGVDNCRFRGGGQPVAIDSNSTITSATGNTIELPNHRRLIFHANGTTEDGTGTIRVAAPTTAPTTQP